MYPHVHVIVDINVNVLLVRSEMKNLCQKTNIKYKYK